ncbi:hypothetical protein SGL43_01276 [Streptomyces globisporus]|uniref:Uncharacterized protein n=1 Tax=Streptomyces globisporus TaxID=1908 RepID=A0ABM9GTW2_STRGL|nr:hypothetical protein SGL43_01276 [Streptomyces globisporus]
MLVPPLAARPLSGADRYCSRWGPPPGSLTRIRPDDPRGRPP